MITLILFASVSVFGVSVFGMDASSCRKLVASSIGDTPSETAVFFANADAAYRDCRAESLPADVRAQAASNYGTAKAIRNNLQAAVAAYKEALNVLSPVETAYSDLTLDVLDRVVRAESQAGLRSDAIDHASRALDIRRTKFGADSPQAVAAMVQLAMVHTTFESYSAAEAILNNAYRAAQKRCGEQCQTLADVYSGFSALYAAQGNEAAERKYDQLGLNATPGPMRRRKD
ncbi:MAG TPA: tetratricopeptide repeat protein [Thermoanaerobaculia bacterium]|nr:tetratricopeptide repeat protein [Thermoanaerobaculia bacterium]